MSAPCSIRKMSYLFNTMSSTHVIIIVCSDIQKHDGHAYDVINKNILKLINIFKIIFVPLGEYIYVKSYSFNYTSYSI